MVEMSPEANSQLTASPQQVSVTFNERVEAALFEIRVLGSGGKEVSSGKPAISEDRKQISVQTPNLPEGHYTVSFRVISSDGHPIGQSYLFTVGEPGTLAVQPPNGQSGHDHHQAGGGNDLLLYVLRTAYLLSLTALAGWVLWGIMLRRRADEAVAPGYMKGSLILRRTFLPLACFCALFQMLGLVEGMDYTEAWAVLLTSAGMAWIIIIVLAVAAAPLLHKKAWSDVLWVGLVLAAESVNGHAAAYDPAWVTLLLNVVHLAAAALWVGGLLYLLTEWSHPERRIHAKLFTRTFSGTALLSIAVLAVSGTAAALLYITDWRLLAEVPWGRWLLAKTAVVIIVVITAALLRLGLKKRQGELAKPLLWLDIGLMAAIIAISAVFTTISPRPSNEPVNWHVMGETVHMTAEISPVIPGKNNLFTVKVWLPEGTGAPKQVVMLLRNEQKLGTAPISVPIVLADQPAAGLNLFPGFSYYEYRASGPYLPFSGEWELEVRVMDPKDDEKVYKRQFVFY